MGRGEEPEIFVAVVGSAELHTNGMRLCKSEQQLGNAGPVRLVQIEARNYSR
jgi:hypothetical protein